jgi:hypothetical protein
MPNMHDIVTFAMLANVAQLKKVRCRSAGDRIDHI